MQISLMRGMFSTTHALWNVEFPFSQQVVSDFGTQGSFH